MNLDVDEFMLHNQAVIMSSIFWHVFLDDIMEANALMKDLEPTTPQEYILKGVVNAALGQEQGIVSNLFAGSLCSNTSFTQQ